MALGTLPPWLHASPELYLHAITSGSQAGLELARIAQAADNAAAGRDLAQQRLAQEANLANERLAYLEQAGADNRGVARERIDAQRDIGDAREGRLAGEHADATSLRQAMLDLQRQRTSNTQDYRDARLAQFQQALDANNTENGDPYAEDIPGAPGVKQVIDSRGKVHIVNPGWMEKLLQGAGVSGSTGGGSDPAAVPNADYTYDWSKKLQKIGK